MLSENLVKSELSLAYVNAVSASSLFATEFTRIDQDSVDLTIRSKGLLTPESTLASPEIHIQLKATVNLDFNSKTNQYSYPLMQKNYDELIQLCMVPRILVILCLPNEQNQWLSHSENDLVLRTCAYWVSLLGLPTSGNSTSTTVYIPKENVFSPDSIRELLVKASKQERL